MDTQDDKNQWTLDTVVDQVEVTIEGVKGGSRTFNSDMSAAGGLPLCQHAGQVLVMRVLRNIAMAGDFTQMFELVSADPEQRKITVRLRSDVETDESGNMYSAGAQSMIQGDIPLGT